MSDLVGNPEDLFSHDEAHICLLIYLCEKYLEGKSTREEMVLGAKRLGYVG